MKIECICFFEMLKEIDVCEGIKITMYRALENRNYKKAIQILYKLPISEEQKKDIFDNMIDIARKYPDEELIKIIGQHRTIISNDKFNVMDYFKDRINKTSKYLMSLKED